MVHGEGVRYEVVFYVEFLEKVDGDSPVLDFINGLTDKQKAKVLHDIELLEEFGSTLREPYSKELKDGIFELRTKCGKTAIRNLYFFYHNQIIVLTNGFIKKTNKTPPREIEKAKKYREEWFRRKG